MKALYSFMSGDRKVNKIENNSESVIVIGNENQVISHSLIPKVSLEELEREYHIVLGAIEEDENLNERQKEILNQIMQEAKDALTRNDVKAQEHSKTALKNFIDCAGKTAEKIITVLSGLATIGTFFGLNIKMVK